MSPVEPRRITFPCPAGCGGFFTVSANSYEAGSEFICNTCAAIVDKKIVQLARSGEDVQFKMAKVVNRPKAAAESEPASKEEGMTTYFPPPGPIEPPAVPTGQQRRPIVEVKADLEYFSELKKSILTKDDVMLIEKKPYIMKSGWMKIALAFNISTEVLSLLPISRRAPIEYQASVKAMAPNGRFMVGVGVCTEAEKKGWSSHKRHDIMVMAEKRATNRAIANLVGCADLSAEEVLEKGGK